MKTLELKTLLISGLFVALQAVTAHAGPSLCNGAPNGILDGDEQCETGACCTVKCELLSAETVCRASAGGACDPAEACGEPVAGAAEAACPADVVAEDGASCEDGQFCTVGETCTAGVCGGGVANTCDDENDCTEDSCNEGNDSCRSMKARNGTTCEDGSGCTTDDTCDNGECIAGPARVCADENACTDDSCDAATGECVFASNTAPCDDGVFCTTEDTCSEGVCTGGPANTCDDGNACTTDTCDVEADACAYGPSEDGIACDDGQFCTVDDTCSAGICVGGGALSCDDANECTADSCNEGNNSCRNSKVQNGTTCEDGSACTSEDTCSSGVCVGGVEVQCADDNLCTDDSCDAATGECLFTNNTAPCDDGAFCTTGDTCGDGVCAGGAGNGCDDGDACTTDSCDEETDGCSYGAADDGTACDDGQFCTADDTCSAGVCVGGAPLDCDDANDCTNDSCNEGSNDCKHMNANNNGPCEDGSFCTVDDACQAGACIGVARDCGDENLCTTDSCNEEVDTCDNLNNSDPCDDGQFCTTGDTCGGGTCSVFTATCDDANVCTTDACNEEADSCSNDNNTAPCEDGSFCTANDTCSGGACVTGPARDCGDGNVCTDDSCNEEADTCDNANNTIACDDALFCTVSDACSNGACTGVARDCNDTNACTSDSCNEASDACDSINNTAPCDDGLFCTANDVCSGGACAAGPARNCSDDNGCTDDTCNEDDNLCETEDNTAACDDGDVCTLDDQCDGGVCVPGAEDPECTPTTTITTTTIDTTTTTVDTTTTTLCGVFCGDFNGDCELTASDALAVLQAAVGINQCGLEVCDFTGDGRVTATDALAVLRAAVGLPSDPSCPE